MDLRILNNMQTQALRSLELSAVLSADPVLNDIQGDNSHLLECISAITVRRAQETSK